MDAYKLLLFLHIVAVVVGLGATFAFPFLQGYAERRGVGPTRFVLQFIHHLDKILIIPGAVLVFVFGIGLYFDDTANYKDSNPAWLSIAMVWFIATFLVAVFVQRPAVVAALKALDGSRDESALPESYKQVAKKTQMVGGLLGLSIIGIAFLMVWKPGN